MDFIKPKYIVGLALAATLTTACSEKMPTVNEENCTQANISHIKDSKIRSEFSDSCFDYKMEQSKEKASDLMEQSADKAEELYEDGKDATQELYEDSKESLEELRNETTDTTEDSKS